MAADKLEISVEQMVRELLSKAIADGLVQMNLSMYPGPHGFTAGELSGVADLLDEYLTTASYPSGSTTRYGGRENGR